MNCYICEKSVRTGGTRYGVRTAAGICHHCGVAVCTDHGYKAAEPGSPLLCPQCAKLEQGISPAQPTAEARALAG